VSDDARYAGQKDVEMVVVLAAILHGPGLFRSVVKKGYGRIRRGGEELVFGAPRVAGVARARARNYGSRKRTEVSQWWVAVVESRPFQTLVDIASTQG